MTKYPSKPKYKVTSVFLPWPYGTILVTGYSNNEQYTPEGKLPCNPALSEDYHIPKLLELGWLEKIEEDSPFESVNLLRKFLKEEPEKARQIIEEFQSTYVEPTGGMGLEEPEEKEYEILRRKQNTISGPKGSFGLCVDTTPGEILSVKRLSDGEVFEVGQHCKENLVPEIYKIEGFQITAGGEMGVVISTDKGIKGEGLIPLRIISKAPEITLIFKTEDGVRYYDPLDVVHGVTDCDDLDEECFRIKSRTINWFWQSEYDYIYFSTRELAEQYVMNKYKGFSWEELQEAYEAGSEGNTLPFTPEESKKRAGI